MLRMQCPMKMLGRLLIAHEIMKPSTNLALSLDSSSYSAASQAKFGSNEWVARENFHNTGFPAPEPDAIIDWQWGAFCSVNAHARCTAPWWWRSCPGSCIHTYGSRRRCAREIWHYSLIDSHLPCLLKSHHYTTYSRDFPRSSFTTSPAHTLFVSLTQIRAR